MALLSLDRVTKHYRLGGGDVVALREVSLSIEQGESVALCGPSGSGKTTLLNISSGLDRPSHGRVLVRGQDLSSLRDDQLSDYRSNVMGFVFQSFNLIPVLSAFENVEYPLIIQNVKRAERRQRVDAVLKAVGLESQLNQRPSQLSGGQQQRVAIARALITKPAIVFADEPTANLDSETGKAILALMRRASDENGTTFVFATHDLGVVEYARRVCRIHDGRIIEDEVRVA